MRQRLTIHIKEYSYKKFSEKSLNIENHDVSIHYYGLGSPVISKIFHRVLQPLLLLHLVTSLHYQARHYPLNLLFYFIQKLFLFKN